MRLGGQRFYTGRAEILLNFLWVVMKANSFHSVVSFSCFMLIAHALTAGDDNSKVEFPSTLTRWKAYADNPIFVGGGPGAWDERIRERGFILREGSHWHFWYTGYNLGKNDLRRLGYATSKDGVHWERQSTIPLLKNAWVEDMQVVKHGGKFIMVAEGRGDRAHTLTSLDGVHWTDYKQIDVRKSDGNPIDEGPYGTPTLFFDKGMWYLFYERGDRGVWLATSKDRKIWTNVQDEPIIKRGPESYDRYAIALNQVIEINNRYYALYHANADPKWRGDWRMCLAVSDDLIHWAKCPGNPILEGDFSSGQLVDDGNQYRLYTPHPQLRLFFPNP